MTKASKQQLSNPIRTRSGSMCPNFSFQEKLHSFILVFPIKSIKSASTEIVFHITWVDISFETAINNNYHLHLNLSNAIIPQKCKYDVSTTNLVVTLMKTEEKLWESLEAASCNNWTNSVCVSRGSTNQIVSGEETLPKVPESLSLTKTGTSDCINMTPSEGEPLYNRIIFQLD